MRVGVSSSPPLIVPVVTGVAGGVPVVTGVAGGVPVVTDVGGGMGRW